MRALFAFHTDDVIAAFIRVVEPRVDDPQFDLKAMANALVSTLARPIACSNAGAR